MSIPKLVVRTVIFIFGAILLAHTLANPAKDNKSEDYKDDFDDIFDPNWMDHYDPWDDPPCPDWNPIDGCGRTPARTKPPATTPKPNERTTHGPGGPSTLRPNTHKLPCTDDEIWKAACLHGGECAVIEVLDARTPFCQCTEQYTGTRCEELDDGFFVLSADKVEKAGIAAGVLAVIIILVVLIVYLVIKKRKARKARTERNGQANGHAGKALIADRGTIEAYDAEEKCTGV